MYGPNPYPIQPFPYPSNQHQPQLQPPYHPMQYPQEGHTSPRSSYPGLLPNIQPQPPNRMDQNGTLHLPGEWPLGPTFPGAPAYHHFPASGYGPGPSNLVLDPSSQPHAPPADHSRPPTRPIPDQPVEPTVTASTVMSPPKRPPRASKRRRGGSAAFDPKSRASDFANPWSRPLNADQIAGSSSTSPSTAWPDGSSTAVSFSSSLDPIQSREGLTGSSSSPRSDRRNPPNQVPGPDYHHPMNVSITSPPASDSLSMWRARTAG